MRSEGHSLVGYGYVRVSSVAQGQVLHGSLEQQRNMLHRWAETQALRTGTEYVLEKVIEDVVSGTRKHLHKRRGYAELISAVKSNKIDFVVIEKVDRLGRDDVENKLFVNACSQFGVKIFEMEGGEINLMDRGSRITFAIKNMMAADYSLELSEKVTKKMREAMVNNGKDSSTYHFLGLDPDKQRTCFYEVNSEEAKIVRSIFDNFISHGSMKETIRFCNEKGYRNKTYLTKEAIDKHGYKIPPKKKGGCEFNYESLRRLLKRPHYVGFSFFRDTWNQFPQKQDEEGFVKWFYGHKAILKEETYIESLRLLDRSAERYVAKKPRSYLLSGILETPDGLPFHGRAAKSSAYAYYVNEKHKISIPRADLEEEVLKIVKKLISDDGQLSRVLNDVWRDKNQHLYRVDDEIAEVAKQIKVQEGIRDNCSPARILDLINLSEKTAETAKKLLSLMDEFEERKKRAEGEIVRLNLRLNELRDKQDCMKSMLRQESVAMHLKEVYGEIEKAEGPRQRRIVQALIPKIIVYPNDLIEVRINAALESVTMEDEKYLLCVNGGSDGT